MRWRVRRAVERGTQRQPLGCYFGCKLGADADAEHLRTVQTYPASRSRIAMWAATRWGSSWKACLFAEVVTGWTAIKVCTTASFLWNANTSTTVHNSIVQSVK